MANPSGHLKQAAHNLSSNSCLMFILCVPHGAPSCYEFGKAGCNFEIALECQVLLGFRSLLQANHASGQRFVQNAMLVVSVLIFPPCHAFASSATACLVLLVETLHAVDGSFGNSTASDIDSDSSCLRGRSCSRIALLADVQVPPGTSSYQLLIPNGCIMGLISITNLAGQTFCSRRVLGA